MKKKIKLCLRRKSLFCSRSNFCGKQSNSLKRSKKVPPGQLIHIIYISWAVNRQH